VAKSTGATDPKLGRHVAIKVLNVVAAANPDGVRRLVGDGSELVTMPGWFSAQAVGASTPRP
jgi:hypothetical protein